MFVCLHLRGCECECVCEWVHMVFAKCIRRVNYHGDGNIGSCESGNYRRGLPRSAWRSVGGSVDERMVCGTTISRRADGGKDTGNERVFGIQHDDGIWKMMV